jgi:hypothetical protein
MFRQAFENTGFPLYEESLLILVQMRQMGIHKADGLRKMTKDKGKHPEKEKELKENFLKDAQKDGGLSETIANKVWTCYSELFNTDSFTATQHFIR